MSDSLVERIRNKSNEFRRRPGCCRAGSVAWSLAFDDPIPLPGRKPILTLRDAARHIMRLSAKDKKSDVWQTAIEALLMAAEERGPIMHATIGVMPALNRHVVPVFDPSRKSTHWGKRKLARDR